MYGQNNVLSVGSHDEMNTFLTQKIDQSIPWGARLRRARQQAGWSLPEAAETLDIQQKYLEALETMNLQMLPGEVYARSFLQRYCRWLDVQAKEVMVEFQRSYRELCAGDAPQRLPIRRVSFRELLVFPRILRFGFAVACALALVLYLATQLSHITQPPSLEVTVPSHDAAVREYMVRIEGKTLPGVRLLVNDERVHPDMEGYFVTTVPLTRGVNIVRVEARQRLSRLATVTRRILLLEGGGPVETISQSNRLFEL